MLYISAPFFSILSLSHSFLFGSMGGPLYLQRKARIFFPFCIPSTWVVDGSYFLQAGTPGRFAPQKNELDLSSLVPFRITRSLTLRQLTATWIAAFSSAVSPPDFFFNVEPPSFHAV